MNVASIKENTNIHETIQTQHFVLQPSAKPLAPSGLTVYRHHIITGQGSSYASHLNQYVLACSISIAKTGEHPALICAAKAYAN